MRFFLKLTLCVALCIVHFMTYYSFKDIIDSWKQPSLLADDINALLNCDEHKAIRHTCGIKPLCYRAVRVWKCRDRIPVKYWYVITLAAKKRGDNAITMQLFYDIANSTQKRTDEKRQCS